MSTVTRHSEERPPRSHLPNTSISAARWGGVTIVAGTIAVLGLLLALTTTGNGAQVGVSDGAGSSATGDASGILSYDAAEQNRMAALARLGDPNPNSYAKAEHNRMTALAGIGDAPNSFDVAEHNRMTALAGIGDAPNSFAVAERNRMTALAGLGRIPDSYDAAEQNRMTALVDLGADES